MKKTYVRTLAAGSAMLLMAANLTGCQSVGVKKTEFTKTEESTYDKPMQNQPEASYWFPEDLLKWDPEEDEDFIYNVSSIPLAERVEKSKLQMSNETQNPEMNVVALSIMNSSTSGNAPHGINTVDANVYSYWQYIDKMVYWGGSSGEGIIVAPSADVIDAAHKNGVPVLGTIFFPQTAHGGKMEWLNTFLKKDGDEFPIVDKLIEVAESYGFDGWFINQETDTAVESFDEAEAGKEANTDSKDGLSKEHAVLMRELIENFQEKAGEELEIMWYDSMTKDGKMDWQNALTDENAYFMEENAADSMFLNFWWTNDKLADKELLKASREKAKEEGVDPYELYAGIDVQAEGTMTPIRWDLFTDEDGVPYTSLGLYCPSWTYYGATDMEDFHAKENQFWVNEKGNPEEATMADGTRWRGISTYAVEQTAVTEVPFVTNFSLGHGYSYFIDGENVSAMDWNNRSMQDILPTYRWTLEQEGKNDLDISIDYANAYNGGNSLKARGEMEKGKVSTWKLYSSELKLEKGTSFTTTAKASQETALDLVLGFEDGTTETISGDKKVGDDWTTVAYDMKKAAGKVVTSISYEVSVEEDVSGYELNLGQIAVTDKKDSVETEVSGVKIEDTCFDEEEAIYTGVRMTWDADETDTVSYYEIYRVNADDTRSFLGATPASSHYLNALQRNDDTNQTSFEIVPVNQNGERGKASEIVTMEWPDNSIPKADFKASKTVAAPGEEITFESLCSENTQEVEWVFEGAKEEKSSEKSPKAVYEKEGVYSVKLTAKNESGETPLEVEGLITITEQAKEGLQLLSKGAEVQASSYVNENEAPKFALDGKTDTKWCATGPAPHEIALDLGEVKTISEVHIAHAEAGNESPDMNTKAYVIEVSEDGVNYTQAAKITGNDAGSTVDAFAAVPARYVKVTIEKPTQGSDTAARIYELEVYGLD